MIEDEVTGGDEDEAPEIEAEADDDDSAEDSETEQSDGDEIEAEDDSDDGDDDDDEDDDEDDEIGGPRDWPVIEHEGQQYRVPPELKNAFMARKHYTQGRQELAEQRKAVAELRQNAERALQASQDELNVRGELSVINQQLQQLEGLNLSQVDPDTALQLRQQRLELLNARDRATQWLQEAQAKRDTAADQELGTRVVQSRRVAAQQIPGWSPENEAAAFQFAINELGASPRVLGTLMDPAIYSGMYYAWIGKQVLDQAANSRTRKRETAPNGQKAKPPMRRNRGKSGGVATKAPRDSDPIDVWMKKREAQIRAKGNR